MKKISFFYFLVYHYVFFLVGCKMDAKVASLNVTFDTGNDSIYTSTPLDDLKQYLTVNEVYKDGSVTSDVDTYTLSGSLIAGKSTITVTSTKDTRIYISFNVSVDEVILYKIQATFNSGINNICYSNQIDDLKENLIVKEKYNDGSTINDSIDYTLSGRLIDGPSTIKVTSTKDTSVNTIFDVFVVEDKEKYKSIDGVLFSKDEKTLIKYCKGYSNKTYIIPNTVTSIGGMAFYSCSSLISIVIPKSVTSIGCSAFNGYNDLIIYTSFSEKPSGWDNSWKDSNITVVWNYNK